MIAIQVTTVNHHHHRAIPSVGSLLGTTFVDCRPVVSPSVPTHNTGEGVITYHVFTFHNSREFEVAANVQVTGWDEMLAGYALTCVNGCSSWLEQSDHVRGRRCIMLAQKPQKTSGRKSRMIVEIQGIPACASEPLG